MEYRIEFRSASRYPHRNLLFQRSSQSCEHITASCANEQCISLTDCVMDQASLTAEIGKMFESLSEVATAERSDIRALSLEGLATVGRYEDDNEMIHGVRKLRHYDNVRLSQTKRYLSYFISQIWFSRALADFPFASRLWFLAKCKIFFTDLVEVRHRYTASIHYETSRWLS